MITAEYWMEGINKVLEDKDAKLTLEFYMQIV